MIRRISIIADLTFRETFRKRIALTSFVLGISFLILFTLGFHFISQEILREPRPSSARESTVYLAASQNFLTIYGLYAVNFMVVIMSALLSADSLAGEIDSGVIQSITCKPIYRREIVLGKFLGFAGFLFVYLCLMAGGIILSSYLQCGEWVPNALMGLGYMYLCSLIILGTTLAFSSRISTIATGAAIFGLYGIAFIGGWVEQIGSFVKSQTAINIGILSSLIMPVEAIWRKASYDMTSPIVKMFMDFTPLITHSLPSPLMIIYGIIYLAVWVWFAVRRFEKRDL